MTGALKLLSANGLLSLLQDLIFLKDAFAWVVERLSLIGPALAAVGFAIAWLVGGYRQLVYPLFTLLPFPVPGAVVDLLLISYLGSRFTGWYLGRHPFYQARQAEAEAVIFAQPALAPYRKFQAADPSMPHGVKLFLAVSLSKDVIKAVNSARREAVANDPDFKVEMVVLGFVKFLIFLAVITAAGSLLAIDFAYRNWMS